MGQVDLLGVAARGLQGRRVDLDPIGASGLEGAFAMVALESDHLIVGAAEGGRSRLPREARSA
jgi:hypothetical protein